MIRQNLIRKIRRAFQNVHRFEKIIWGPRDPDWPNDPPQFAPKFTKKRERRINKWVQVATNLFDRATLEETEFLVNDSKSEDQKARDKRQKECVRKWAEENLNAEEFAKQFPI